MKVSVLILSFLLSCLFGGKPDTSVATAIVQQATEQNCPDDGYAPEALLPVQPAGYSGGSNGPTSALRRSSNGQRTQTSPKFPFRVIKGGRVIDRNKFYDFQTELHQFQSGINSLSRYIHTICHLLI